MTNQMYVLCLSLFNIFYPAQKTRFREIKMVELEGLIIKIKYVRKFNL